MCGLSVHVSVYTRCVKQLMSECLYLLGVSFCEYVCVNSRGREREREREREKGERERKRERDRERKRKKGFCLFVVVSYNDHHQLKPHAL